MDSLMSNDFYKDADVNWPIGKPPIAKPVATQLGRIEQGLDALLQSHAALEERLTAKHEMIDGMARDMKLLFSLYKGMSDGLQQGIADIHRLIDERSSDERGKEWREEIRKRFESLQAQALEADFKVHAKAGKRGRHGRTK